MSKNYAGATGPPGMQHDKCRCFWLLGQRVYVTQGHQETKSKNVEPLCLLKLFILSLRK